MLDANQRQPPALCLDPKKLDSPLSPEESLALRSLPVHTLGSWASKQNRDRHGLRTTRTLGESMTWSELLNRTWIDAKFSLGSVLRISHSMPAGAQAPDLASAMEALKQAHPTVSIIAGSTRDFLEFPNKGQELMETLGSSGLKVFGEGSIITDSLLENQCDFGLERSIDAYEAAHRAGLRISASVAYARTSGEKPFVEDLLRLRDFQAKTSALISVAVIGTIENGLWTSGLEDFRHVALARLILMNVDHITVGSPHLGLPLGPCQLSFGANDIDQSLIQTPKTPLRGNHSSTEHAEGRINDEELERWILETGFSSELRNAEFEPISDGH